MEINEKQIVTLLQFIEFSCESDDEDDLEFLMSMSSSSNESEEKEVRNFITVVDLVRNGQRSKTQIRPRIREYVERIVPNYTAEEFKTHFRLLSATFEFLLELIGPALNATKSVSGRKPIAAQKQLLIALWIMATPDSYRSVCVKFNVGKATAICTMRRVTYALHTLASRFIQWPQGAIDGIHIDIRAPQEDKQSYVNRKEYHSIHVQAVCTQNLLFTSVLAGNVGSVHDARVLWLSPIRHYIENPLMYFPNDSHIVRDAAYARIAIERAFGLWKGRWRNVLDCLPMITLEKIPGYLVATCVLHNICILKGDLIDFDQAYEQDISRGTLIFDRMEDGNAKRQRIMNSLIMRVN